MHFGPRCSSTSRDKTLFYDRLCMQWSPAVCIMCVCVCMSDSSEVICIRWIPLHSDPSTGSLVSLPLVFNPWHLACQSCMSTLQEACMNPEPTAQAVYCEFCEVLSVVYILYGLATCDKFSSLHDFPCLCIYRYMSVLHLLSSPVLSYVCYHPLPISHASLL